MLNKISTCTILPRHRGLKRRNRSEGLLQLQVTDMTLEIFVKNKEKATQLTELLLLLRPRLNCNFLICIYERIGENSGKQDQQVAEL